MMQVADQTSSSKNSLEQSGARIKQLHCFSRIYCEEDPGEEWNILHKHDRPNRLPTVTVFTLICNDLLLSVSTPNGLYYIQAGIQTKYRPVTTRSNIHRYKACNLLTHLENATWQT
jgi:hypothetical protein